MGLYASSDRIKELWAAMKSRFIGAKKEYGYWGIVNPDGAGFGWVRTTERGIIPYSKRGGSWVGTSSWQFDRAYAANYYENNVLLSDKYAAINHAHSPMAGSSASAAGTAGIVPAPPAGAATRYLRCDGSWVAPPGGIDYRPKDSVYLTKGAESPAALFGGTWTKRADTFLFSGYKIWERVG